LKGTQQMSRQGDLDRGRLEAFEGREARDKLAKAEAESASAARSRHFSGGTRVNVAGVLNKMAGDDALRARPGLEALEAMRKACRLGYRSAADHNRAHDVFEKAGGLEAFNRLHPLRKDDIAVADAKTKSKYDPSGDVSGIEPAFLLQVARMLLAMARARAAAAPAGRRD
jgi:hypothetical protein